MAIRMRDALGRARDELRYEPTDKRVRATLGGETVTDSVRALLVWEPRRVVPTYAVPLEDIAAELGPGPGSPPPLSSRPGVLHPGIPFSVHSCEGENLSVRAGAHAREGGAFRPSDPDLAGYVALDFDAFDSWYEEDEAIVGHPRDPFHRIDIRRSSRPVRIELEGRILAESARPCLLFETSLPVRFYIPREDLRVDLHPNPKRTYCPYKGQASYWSFEIDGRRYENLCWTIEHPLPDAVAITSRVAFFDEKVDVTLSGRRRERPRTAFSAAILDECGLPSSEGRPATRSTP